MVQIHRIRERGQDSFSEKLSIGYRLKHSGMVLYEIGEDFSKKDEEAEMDGHNAGDKLIFQTCRVWVPLLLRILWRGEDCKYTCSGSIMKILALSLATTSPSTSLYEISVSLNDCRIPIVPTHSFTRQH